MAESCRYFGFDSSLPLRKTGTDFHQRGEMHVWSQIAEPVWLDTVNIPYAGTVDAGMDFTDPRDQRQVCFPLPSSPSRK
jgi:hypothetical protein